MNWKKVSIDRLREYDARVRSLELIPEQIKVLKMDFDKIKASSTDSISVMGGNRENREDMLINNIVEREELQRNYDIVQKEVDITRAALGTLTDNQEKILNRFYVDRHYGHVDRLCEELCIEKSRVYTMKDEALRKFTLACYGIIEL